MNQIPNAQHIDIILSAADVGGMATLTGRLNEILPDGEFEHVLTRSGWHRLGGLVDTDLHAVAPHVAAWAESVTYGDVDALVLAYADAGYRVTRIEGRTHYLVAASGEGSANFLQLEVEELQEVLDRELLAEGFEPETLDELIDPLDYPRLDPEPVAPVRFVFRRVTRIDDQIRAQQKTFRRDPGLQRFIDDWDASSAGARALRRHWVYAIRRTPDSDGAVTTTMRPISTDEPRLRPMIWTPERRGADLANAIHAFDHAAGYSFAWYFHMLANRLVPFEVAEAVLADVAEGYDYLPPRDMAILHAWQADRYAV